MNRSIKSQQLNQRIYISKTEKQWEVIDARIKEIGGKGDFNAFINRRISILKAEIEECPDCVCQKLKCGGEKLIRQYPINDRYLEALKLIEFRTGLKPSTIVNELIVLPLLLGR